MRQYLELMEEILTKGNRRIDRTGTGTVSLFGRQMVFDLSEGFPLVTTKQVFTRGLIEELLWMRDGDTNNNTLVNKNVHIWDEWAVVDRVPMTYAELVKSLCDNVPGLNPDSIVVFKTDESGELTRERIPHEEVPMEMTAYGELLELIEKTGTLHKKNIPTTKPRMGGMDGELGPVYGAQWRRWKIPQPKQERLALVDRLDLAKGFAEDTTLTNRPFTLQQYHHLQRAFDLANGTKDQNLIEAMHDQLTDWGIQYYKDTPAYVDQLMVLMEGLKKRPFSRRHIVSAWNVADLPDESKSPQQNVLEGRMSLASCHTLVQFYVSEMNQHDRIDWIRANRPEVSEEINETLKKEIEAERYLNDDDGLIARNYELFDAVPNVPYKLSCKLYQRSADYCLGVPFNTASYALLTAMIAQCVDMVPGEFIHSFGDSHIYANHIEKAQNVQLPREPLPLPKLWLNPEVKDLFAFTIDDIKIVDYVHHPKIVYDVSV